MSNGFDDDGDDETSNRAFSYSLETSVRIFNVVIAGTIAPAIDQSGGGEYNIQVLLSNLNLVVPVASSILVIIVAIIVICVLRGKNSQNKGLSSFVLSGTIAPPENDSPVVNEMFPWLPDWANLNILVPIAATIVVIFVGCVVICVAVSRKSRGPEQTRLRGTDVAVFTPVMAY